MADGPLIGFRILDLTAVISGPFCTQLLGDLGADVIKIEPPEGDSMRRNVGPQRGGLTAAFLNFNRNKRSIVIDIKKGARPRPRPPPRGEGRRSRREQSPRRRRPPRHRLRRHSPRQSQGRLLLDLRLSPPRAASQIFPPTIPSSRATLGWPTFRGSKPANRPPSRWCWRIKSAG